MKEITENYNRVKTEKSDIYLHIPRLKNIAEECDSIMEMGTRHVVSAWAFAKAKPKKLTCVDMYESENISKLKRACKENGIQFNFLKENTLELNIEEPVDLLFIDTKHTYSQLKDELKLHSSKVKKYIAFHDTETFGRRSEGGNNEKGLMDAIEEFLETHPEWKIKEIYKDSNGLTIIERINTNKTDAEDKFCIASFCFSERYRNIAKKRIVKSCEENNINLIILTDRPAEFPNLPNLRVFNINEYQDSRKLIHKYFEFDFSVKRFSLKKAYELGYKKILLADCDTVIVSPEILADTINKRCTKYNAVYPFSAVYNVDFERFGRLKYYLEENNTKEDFLKKNKIVSEDLQQLFTFKNDESFQKFFNTWEQLEEIKKHKNIQLRPRSSIEEIAYSSYINGIDLIQEAVPTGIRAVHNAWYRGSKESVLQNTRYVSCMYGNNSLYNGHPNKQAAYIASLECIVKNMNDNITIYHSYWDRVFFKDNKFFYNNRKERELNDYYFSNISNNLDSKVEYHKKYPRRSLDVQWAKFCMLEEEMKDMLDEESIYWIDAGIAHPGNIPKEFNPNIDVHEEYSFTEDMAKKNHDFSKLFTKTVATNIASESKIFVIHKWNGKPEGGYIEYPRNLNGGGIIGGFWGGRVIEMKLFVALFKNKLMSLLAEGKCYTEESIMTSIVDENIELFNIKKFDIWQPQIRHRINTGESTAFYQIFEEYL